MLYYLLFFIYFLLLVYLLRKNSIIKDSGFSDVNLLLLFILKVGAGLAIGWMSATYYAQGNDYWTLHREGLLEYDLLIHHPKKFISDFFQSPYENKYGGFFDAVGSYWNDLKNNIIIKILAMLNIFSRGNYYINSLFLNTFSFIGTIALASIFYKISKKKFASIAGCFFIPTNLYFSSGIHKDLFVFTMLGFFFYALYFLIENSRNIRLWFLLCMSVVILMIMRNTVVLLLIPSLIFLFFRLSYFRTLKSMLVTCFICLICVTALHFTAADPLQLLVQRQQDFLELPAAYSQLPLKKLTPDLQSFISVFPEAFNHAFWRPYIWEYPGHFLLFTGIELFCMLLLIFGLLFKKRLKSISPFYITSFIFAFLIILLAGFIVPNAGTLVRYRSVYLHFLLTPILIMWSTMTNKSVK